MKALLLGESIGTEKSQREFQKDIETLLAKMGVSRVDRLDPQNGRYPSVEGYILESERAFSINYFGEPLERFSEDGDKLYRGRLVSLGLDESEKKMLKRSLDDYVLKTSE